MKPRPCVVVDTEEKLIECRRSVKRYLRQSYKTDTGAREPARLAVDVETYRKYPAKIPGDVPRAIWNGEYWEGYVSILGIGFDTSNDLKIRDRQFLVDVIALGEEKVAAAFKDLFEDEDTVLICHNAPYELSFLAAHFDIRPKWVIDPLLISQILRAGSHDKHDLAACYQHYFNGRGIFKNLTGQTFKEYAAWKKKMQKADWTIRPLPREMRYYQADDERMLFPLYECMTEEIDSYVRRVEKNFPDNKGIEHVMLMELALRPLYTELEQYGIRMDLDYYRGFALPLMRKMVRKTVMKLAEYPAFKPRYKTDERTIQFVAKDIALGKIKKMAKRKNKETNKMELREVEEPLIKLHGGNLKAHLKVLYPQTAFSVKQKKHGNQGHKLITVSWKRVKGKRNPRRRDVYSLASTVFSEERGYSYNPQHTINLNARTDAVLTALSDTCGIKLKRTKEEYLRDIVARQKARGRGHDVEVIEDYLNWVQANTVYTRYGEGLLRWVSPIGLVHPSFKQIGREGKEIKSGRSSCTDPNMMFISARDELYEFDPENSINSGKLVRSAFVPTDPDCEFWDGDFGNIEPRMTAQITRDKKLTWVFVNDLDMHRLTAAQNLGKGYDEVTKEERDNFGKTINLGMSYGMGYKLLIEHCRKATKYAWTPTEDEAKKLHKSYLSLYAGIPIAMDKAEREITKRLVKAGTLVPFLARSNNNKRIPFGLIVDELGRPTFRYVPKHLENPLKFSDAELDESYNPDDEWNFYNEFKRVVTKSRLSGYNHTVQGSAAEVLKLAQLYLYRAIRKKGWDPKKNRIVLIVHDELLCQFEKRYHDEARELISNCMMRAAIRFIKRVPVSISLGCGPNWYAAKVDADKKENKVSNIDEFKDHPLRKRKKAKRKAA